MKKRKLPNRTLPKPVTETEGPPRHEWLFGDRSILPDDQTEAAYYWEFGLAVPEVVSEVNAMRDRRPHRDLERAAHYKWLQQNPVPTDSSLWPEWTRKMFDANPSTEFCTRLQVEAHFLADWPEFPDRHWLQIQEGVRRDEKRYRPSGSSPHLAVWHPDYCLHSGEQQPFATEPSVFCATGVGVGCHTEIIPEFPADLNLRRDWADTTKSPWGFASPDRWRELRLVRVHWARSDRNLKADFAHWLKENRPDDRQSFHASKHSDSRRTTFRDLLKALGAARLLRHFKQNWKNASDFSALFCKDGHSNPKSLYEEQTEWRRAAVRAEQAIQDFAPAQQNLWVNSSGSGSRPNV